MELNVSELSKKENKRDDTLELNMFEEIDALQNEILQLQHQIGELLKKQEQLLEEDEEANIETEEKLEKTIVRTKKKLSIKNERLQLMESMANFPSRQRSTLGRESDVRATGYFGEARKVTVPSGLPQCFDKTR
jgi:regulator of replication initiation timing